MSINPIGCKSGLQPSEISSEKKELFSQLPTSIIEKIFSYLNSSDYKKLINAYEVNQRKVHLEEIGEGSCVQVSLRNNDYLRTLPLEDLLIKGNKSPDDCEVIFNRLQQAAIHGDIKSVQKILSSNLQEIEPFDGDFTGPSYQSKFYQFDWKSLQEVIVLAAQHNHSPIVEELMTSEWYRDTCSFYDKKDYRVNEALIQAVIYGSQQCVEKILQHGQDLISEEVLIQAIIAVIGRIPLYSSSDYVNIKNLLIKEAKKRNIESSRYEKIVEDVSTILIATVQDGSLDQASNIINSLEFDKIDKECLNKVWNIVCEKKSTDIAIKLIQSSKFSQIQLFDYLYGKKQAHSFFSCFENKRVIRTLIASERFAKLNSDDLNCIWRKANFVVLEELIKCPRFKDIGETALGETLIKAAKNSVEVLKALIDSPRFQEIDKKDLESALLNSLKYRNSFYKEDLDKNALMLIENSRFQQIGETALGEALIKAAGNSAEALKALVDSPRFNQISFTQEGNLGNKTQSVKPLLSLLINSYVGKELYKSDKDYFILRQIFKHKDIYQFENTLFQQILYQMISKDVWIPLTITLKSLKMHSLFEIKDKDLEEIQSYIDRAVNESINKRALRGIVEQIFQDKSEDEESIELSDFFQN